MTPITYLSMVDNNVYYLLHNTYRNASLTTYNNQYSMFILVYQTVDHRTVR